MPATVFLLRNICSAARGSWASVFAQLHVHEVLHAELCNKLNVDNAAYVLAMMCSTWEPTRVFVIGTTEPLSLVKKLCNRFEHLTRWEFALLANLALTNRVELKKVLCTQLEPLPRFICDWGLPLLRNLAAGGSEGVACVLPILDAAHLKLFDNVSDSSSLFEFTGNVIGGGIPSHGSDTLRHLLYRSRAHLKNPDLGMRLGAIRCEYNLALCARPEFGSAVGQLPANDSHLLIYTTVREILSLLHEVNAEEEADEEHVDGLREQDDDEEDDDDIISE